jgi:O-antigen/teichoic acid export membrane protein
MREATRKLSIIVLPSFIFLFAHAYDFVTVLFTKAYADSVSVFRICVWELPLDMLVLSAIPQVFGKTRVNLYINIAATALMLLASYILVRSFGVYGAAVVATATQWFTVLLFFIVVARLTHSSVTALLPLMGIARVLVAALAAATVSRLVGDVTPFGLVNLAVAAAIFTVVFFIVAAPLGVFTSDDRALLRRWLGKFSFVKA